MANNKYVYSTFFILQTDVIRFAEMRILYQRTLLINILLNRSILAYAQTLLIYFQ